MMTPDEIVKHFAALREKKLKMLELEEQLEFALLIKAIYSQHAEFDEGAAHPIHFDESGCSSREVWLKIMQSRPNEEKQSVAFLCRKATSEQYTRLNIVDLYGNPHLPERFVDLVMQWVLNVDRKVTLSERRRREKRTCRGGGFRYNPSIDSCVVVTPSPGD